MPGISPKLPLLKHPVDGFSLNRTYNQAVKQNFKNLVLTSPGERIMDPDFGVGIRRYLFENFDDFTFDEIEEKIMEQVGLYMPYIELIDIQFQTPPAEEYENYMNIIIEFNIQPTNSLAILDLSF